MFNPKSAIYIDADATPKTIRDWIIEATKRHGLTCRTVASYNHDIVYEHHLSADAGPEAVDFKILSLMKEGDLVITQDYGLAGLVLAKRGDVITPNGMRLNNNNIEHLLAIRAEHRHFRKGGIRVKGPKKRTLHDDLRFQDAFDKWLLAEC